jgi:hypothetical protein
MSSTTPKSSRSEVHDGKVEYDNTNKCTPDTAPVSCNEKRRQPLKELVEQINQQTEATEGDSNEKLEKATEWFTSKEGYYYSHTT